MGTLIGRQRCCDEAEAIIAGEGLLPDGLLERLQSAYPQYADFAEKPRLFDGPRRYVGLQGFRDIVAILHRNGVELGDIRERELFIEVYRFMATRHILNSINWSDFNKDPIFQMVFPQPGMMRPELVKAYLAADSDEKRRRLVEDYIQETNPHDGKQKLNKPVFRNSAGEAEVLDGCQHKYPQCHLIFDVQTQYCFSFCNYCFRHAQVRGDQDMFLQKDIAQIHRYLRLHPEVTDLLITGGDAGFMTSDRFTHYVEPILEDPALKHIRSIRLGSRVLTYDPEHILSRRYEGMLGLFKKLHDHGVQPVFMSHFSTPREILNPGTIAAIRRLQAHGAVVKSQSPIMKHVSLYLDEKGEIDIDRSAQNWIDLGNILAMLSVGFHAMYIPRPTGEYHYFTAPLAAFNKVFSKIYRSLASINRPSRYITMTMSSGKISLLGTLELEGKTLFVLKFNEARNMEWMDRVYLAEYDEKETVIENLKPYKADRYFYAEELAEIERRLEASIAEVLTAGSACFAAGGASQAYDQ